MRCRSFSTDCGDIELEPSGLDSSQGDTIRIAALLRPSLGRANLLHFISFNRRQLRFSSKDGVKTQTLTQGSAKQTAAKGLRHEKTVGYNVLGRHILSFPLSLSLFLLHV